MKKELKVTAELGIPTQQAYFGMLDWLVKRGYTVKKTDDWLYINPKTAHHAEVMQRRQATEGRLAQIMIYIGEQRHALELLKHDLRKFENALEHHRKNNLDVLKSDYMDFIDMQSPNSMFQLARAGRFPSIVADFFKIKSERDIDDLKISKSEKSILQIKWKQFQQWRDTFSKAVEERVRVLREELNARNASLENYKASLRPYIDAMHKMKVSEHAPADLLSNPMLIEGYMTSVAGVDLAAWRGALIPGRQMIQESRTFMEGEEAYPFYIYIEISIRRDQVVNRGKEIEGMRITIDSSLKSADEIIAKKKEIKDKEDALMKSLEEFRGEREMEAPKEEAEEEETVVRKLHKAASESAKTAETYLRGSLAGGSTVKDVLEKTVKEETIALYDAIKEMTGGMKLQRYPLERE
ncbi:MAG: hypothetical protein HYS81_02880 [Candidatus Aenigmatarchaeota archaeon]|nr:MAG: hypothetical protein HYS81_02880 [Candidatus Aenigmarchaeota archaeon]